MQDHDNSDFPVTDFLLKCQLRAMAEHLRSEITLKYMRGEYNTDYDEEWSVEADCLVCQILLCSLS